MRLHNRNSLYRFLSQLGFGLLVKERMVKGGTKRKPEMKKITNKASRATTFSKRRDGLYSKAAQLCVLSDAQIAILATPSSSSNSNASFFSFGHSSVESVVSAYLAGQRLPPVSSSRDTREDLGICMARKDLGLGFWWDDEKLANSKNPEELLEAMESMKVLMSHLKGLENQTLTTVDEEISPELDEWSEMELTRLLQDCDDDVPPPPPPPPPLFSNTDKEEEDQTVSDNNNNNNSVSSLPEKSLEEVTMDLDFDSIFEGLVPYDEADLFWSDDLLLI
ncbi:agamous-like MADS-box protein AGL97 [Brassica napus]|nr:agamous-like MADS-box protein AGL97 [Brassica napus]